MYRIKHLLANKLCMHRYFNITMSVDEFGRMFNARLNLRTEYWVNDWLAEAERVRRRFAFHLFLRKDGDMQTISPPFL